MTASVWRLFLPLLKKRRIISKSSAQTGAPVHYVHYGTHYAWRLASYDDCRHVMVFHGRSKVTWPGDGAAMVLEPKAARDGRLGKAT